VLSFFTLVFGELVPKRIAMNKAESLAFALSSLILFISKIFAPIVWLLTKTTNGILRIFGIDPNAQEDEVTEEEIRLLVDAGSEKGAIAEGEKEIIDNVFEFDDKTAEEVMTHRRDTIILWLDDDDAAWDKIIRETDHSRYPVCGENEDDVRGVLDARNYFELFTAGLDDIKRGEVMAKAVEPPQLVPATIPTNVLFRKMKKRRNHFAVVIDEYGGMDGVVTMNDLLEELVGDIAENEADAEAPAIVTRAPGVWQISGGAPLDKVARETGAPLPAADYDTFGGYVFTLLGRIPDDGETFDIEAEGLRINVVSVKDHRLERALVRRQGKQEG
jgi:putative hemolysin